MIALIGNGYIGSSFERELRNRREPFRIIHHNEVDTFWKAHGVFKEMRPELIINCAAFIPHESVRLCDNDPKATIIGNVVFPISICNAAEDQGISFAHISTGCLWNDGMEHTEEDPPQRSFNGYCGFYIGTKAMADDQIRAYKKHYIWRVRLPFDEMDTKRNYLRKLIDFKEVWEQQNSLCHRADFAAACLDLWKIGAPFGTYNMNNPGSVSVRDIIDRMMRFGILTRLPNIIDKKDGQCVLSCDKLTHTGVRIRHITDALEESIKYFGKAIPGV